MQPLHKWPPHRNRPTAPRGSTAKRMDLQRRAGYPMLSKVAIVLRRFKHPTKRNHYLGVPKPEQVVVRPPRPPVHPVQACVQRMTGWQRTQWSRATAALRREEKKLTAKDELALAESYAELKRRS